MSAKTLGPFTQNETIMGGGDFVEQGDYQVGLWDILSECHKFPPLLLITRSTALG
jgi:hypothetical protein